MRNKVSYNGSEVTGIKVGTFHYSASAGEVSTVRPGGIYASYIEFEYYLDNGVSLAIGDVVTYSQVIDVDKSFAPIAPAREVIINNFNIVDIKKTKTTCYVLAYDDCIKLDVDYSARLKSLESQFPMTIGNLVNDIATFCGVTFSFDLAGNINDYVSLRSTTINYFYSSGITAREIIGYIVSLRWCYMTCVYGNGSTILSAANRWSKTVGWENNFEYIICPDDTDYSYTSGGLDYAKYNVWYKEHGLEYGDDIPDYDGVEIYSDDGTLLGFSYDTSPPTNVYVVYGNVIAKNINTFYQGVYVDYGYDRLAANILWCLGNYTSQHVASATIFPFREPLCAGSTAFCVNTDGTKFSFRVVNVDITNERCVLSSSQITNGSLTNCDSGGNGASLGTQVNEIKSQLDNLLDYCHPVGSIYISTDPTDPGTLFGGTWEQIKDTFLLTAGDTYTAGDTGGEATHTLTISEIPSHTHDIRHYSSSSANTAIAASVTSQKYADNATYGAFATGGDGAHNNMPPYLVVYAWQRVADSVDYLVTIDGDYLTTVDGDYLTL